MYIYIYIYIEIYAWVYHSVLWTTTSRNRCSDPTWLDIHARKTSLEVTLEKPPLGEASLSSTYLGSTSHRACLCTGTR